MSGISGYRGWLSCGEWRNQNSILLALKQVVGGLDPEDPNDREIIEVITVRLFKRGIEKVVDAPLTKRKIP